MKVWELGWGLGQTLYLTQQISSAERPGGKRMHETFWKFQENLGL